MDPQTQRPLLPLPTDVHSPSPHSPEAVATSPCPVNPNPDLKSDTVSAEHDSCHAVDQQDDRPHAYDLLGTCFNSAFTVADGHGALESCQNVCGRYTADSTSLETVNNVPEVSEVTVNDCHITGSSRGLQDSIKLLNEDAMDVKGQADEHRLHDYIYNNGKLRMIEDVDGAKSGMCYIYFNVYMHEVDTN